MNVEKEVKVDASVSFDLDILQKLSESESPHHLIGMTTPDGLPCIIAKVRVHKNDESIIEIEFQSPLGPISFLIPKENLEKLTATAKEVEEVQGVIEP